MLRQPLHILPGLWQITLPLPFELSSVNTYLLRRNRGWTLIDTGLRTQESYDELRAQMAHAGVALEEISEILLTHSHPDHVGGVKRLMEETGAPLLMSHDELDQVLRVARSEEKPWWLDERLRAAGVPEELITKIENSFALIRSNFQELAPAQMLEDGQVLSSDIGPLELIETPGHSPGHMCLYNRDHKLMLSGDHILEFITPNIGWLPERDALGEFFQSLERVHPLEIDTLLPGHGEPFRGHQPWISATRSHHDVRCEQILASLAGNPRTAHELVGDLWPRTLAPFHHRFAVFEVLAHLEYLRRREQVVCEAGSYGHQIWRI